jgi:protein tyrosine phosphatase (PTP) superfamily phosphohydrolase (DUF442 family)
MARPYTLTTIAILTALFAGCAKPDSAQQADDSDGGKSVAAAQISDSEGQPQQGKQPRRPTRIEVEHLENVYQIHPKVISGGEPHGAKGFESLARLGVKTIISVDGAKPDLKLAGKHGMRYVHLPHSYDGVPEQRAKELAKAVRDLDGPIYIHCHHGKHRSPAASAVACVGAGLIGAGDVLAILTTAGTSTNYRGLYKSTEQARRLDDALLDALKVEFRETVEVPPLADAMVALERTHDHVKQMAAAGWRPLPSHPDLDPAHEALLLREHYTELLRTDDLKGRDAEFQKLMRDGEEAAISLENLLIRIKERSYPAGKVDLHKPADAALAAINKNCAVCHAKFRDVPLDEK